MAVLQSGATTDLATITPTFKALRGENRPLDHGALGHYRYSDKTGTLAAALAAGAVIFAFRWGDTNLAAINWLRVRFQANVLFTAAAANLSLSATIGRTYTASHTGGTAATSSGNNLKLRTSFPTSKINTNGDIRIATTAALGGGTVTADAHPFAYGGPGRANYVNTAAGTEVIYNNNPIGNIDYSARVADAEHPIVLAQNEGILVRNVVVWPAAGTGEVSVEIGWTEIAAY